MCGDGACVLGAAAHRARRRGRRDREPPTVGQAERVTCIRSVVVAVVLVLVGCGRQPAAGDDVASSAAVSATWAAAISSVSAHRDGHSVIARVDVLPVEGPTGACHVEIDQSVDVERDVVFVGVTFRSGVEGPDPAFPECETAPREVIIDVGSPLDRRHIITQTPQARWRPTTDDGYERCDLPSCDPATGTAPKPAACDDSTLADAARNSDVPRHSGLGNKRCRLPWAVIDVDVGAGSCPASGDGKNPCAGHIIRRTYWRAAGYTWEQVGASTGAGCGDVVPIVPEFPIDLCADLPPIG